MFLVGCLRSDTRVLFICIASFYLAFFLNYFAFLPKMQEKNAFLFKKIWWIKNNFVILHRISITNVIKPIKNYSYDTQ